MDIKQAIGKVIEGENLTEAEMVEVMNIIMTGSATDAQTGSFLTALRIKGETVEEITGAARVMREKAVRIDPGDGDVVDTCGTGGSRLGAFNISTTSAFVVAGAGLKVAKHGNRAISSMCGSADVLMALGVNLEADAKKVEACLQEVGIGFLFAPLMHGAMKHAIGPRRELGVRTIFNLLGPLTNPAGARRQVIGVYDKALVEPIANVLARLGSDSVFVVHGCDGLDEITITGSTHVARMKDGKVNTFTIKPEDFGIKASPASEIKGGDATANAKITRDILGGIKGAMRDVTVLNASAAICAGGLAESIKEAIAIAEESIDSGKATGKLEKMIEFLNG
ncbi:Anthranilate phosphoribosyltransferase [hydrothermal vent metagenome]|uniref:anthranilate phosphoribosyltransferase n=1 Tax=hydrothermal vent metagenome TaxID=652676 RepID=A0A3B1D012_9ZZZZ